MTVALADAKVSPRGMLVSWCVFVTAAIVILGLLRAVTGKTIVTLVSIAVSVYGTLCAALALYRIYTHEWLDLMVLLAIPRDTVATMRIMVGDGLLAAAAVLLLLHAAVYCLGAIVMAGAVAAEDGARRKTVAAAIVLVPGLAWAGAPHADLLVDEDRYRTAAVRPLMDRTPYTIAPEAPVFLIQLESLNALAVNGEYETGGKRVLTDGIPVMRRLAAEGILFPHIWSVDVQTHRVQQAFLCGALRNMSSRPFFKQVLYEGGCLPDLFRKAGYKTVFLKGVDDPGFADAYKIMPVLGYQDVRFDEIMQPGDENHGWGYEEGIYFQRGMEYLERTYRPGERLFVHFAVSAHHVSFTRRRQDSFEWFRVPHAQQLEEYIASSRKQDAAVAPLVERIRRFTGGNAHIFVFGDHSYPIALYGALWPWDGATVDNFVTVMLYLPPASRASEFALGRTVNTLYSQTDLAATLAELTSGKPHRNSLVPVMLRTPPAQFEYERCHVMTQPYGDHSVMIAHGETAYIYTVATRCIETVRLTYDPLRQHPVSRECDKTLEEFEERYMCARYRRSPVAPATPLQSP